MKHIFEFYCILISIFVLVNAELIKIPDYIKVCRKNDPNIANCIKNSIEALRPNLREGISELGVVPIEPFNLGDLVISNKRDNGIDLFIHNVKVYDASKFQISKFRNKNYIQYLHIDLIFPSLNISGNYIVDGSILSLPLKGKGNFESTFSNSTGIVKIVTEIVQNDNGDEILSIKSVNIKVKMNTGKIKLDNLFRDKAINEAINDSINENIHIYANEIIPSIETALENKFKDIMNKIINKFTLSQLLPDS